MFEWLGILDFKYVYQLFKNEKKGIKTNNWVEEDDNETFKLDNQINEYYEANEDLRKAGK